MTRWFIRVLAIALVLAAAAGGYIWYRSYVAGQLGLALNSWILARTAEGYGIAADIAPESGTLTAVTRRLSDVTIAAPGYAWTLQFRNLDILVSPLSPFSVEFQADGWAELGYTVADENYLLTNDFQNGAAGFSYDREGRITAAYLHESGARLDGPISVDIDSFEARLDLDPAAPPSEDGKSAELNVALENATVTKTGPLPLGNLIQHVDLAAYMTGTLRPGRPSESLAAWRDGGGVLQIQRLVANWGPLSITAEGTLALDGQLQPLFAGTANVRGYNEAIDAMAQAGMLELGQVTGAKIALAAMTKPGEDGGPPAARVPITIQDGFLYVGPLKLAQMPRIVWQ